MRFFGCIFILTGLSIWFDPVVNSSKFQMTIDYTDQKIPICLLFIIIGGLLIWTTFRRKK
jgi:predicted transporter